METDTTKPDKNILIDGVDENQDDLYIEKRRRGGCWDSFIGFISGMWITRQMANTKDREVVVRTTLRELIVYIVFLVLLCTLSFGMSSASTYYFTRVLSELFLDSPYSDTHNTFRGSTQVLDIWRFVQGPLLDGLYWEKWYDTSETPVDGGTNNVLYQSKLLGVPRMRQIRVRDDSCKVHDSFSGAIDKCYNTYSENIEDKASFGIKNGTAWHYYSEKELGSQSTWGLVNVYSGAGAYVDLGVTRRESELIMANLRNNIWIDRGTRAIFIDFSVYNANINLFCVVKLIFELPPTGGVIPSHSFRTVKLLRYVTPFDYFVMACEWIFVFFILYYIVEEVLEIKTVGWKYFHNVWNLLDILVIVIALLCVSFSVYRIQEVDDKLESLLNDDIQYANFETLGFYQTQFNSAVAVCIFFAWIKVFKYISFNKTMNQLSSTLSRCAKDVAGFAIMFFIVFFAFAQLGYLLFGTQVKDYRSFGNATFTLLRLILGDFDFHEIEVANRVLGPIYFLAYVFFVFFVLMNMFLAIINETYSEVKAELSAQKNEFEIVDYFRRSYNNIMGKLGKRDKLIDIQNALKLADTNNDGVFSFDEIRKNLKNCNFSDLEIEMFFSRYDLDGDRNLGDAEAKMMMADLEDQRHELDRQMARPMSGQGSARPSSAMRDINGDTTYTQFNRVTARVDSMESNVGTIVAKIDSLLGQLHSAKSFEAKSQSTVDQLMDGISDDLTDDAVTRESVENMLNSELQNWQSTE